MRYGYRGILPQLPADFIKKIVELKEPRHEHSEHNQHIQHRSKAFIHSFLFVPTADKSSAAVKIWLSVWRYMRIAFRHFSVPFIVCARLYSLGFKHLSNLDRAEIAQAILAGCMQPLSDFRLIDCRQHDEICDLA
jgi:hypothetical protein